VKFFGRTPIETVRWVVVDCETSGLDAARERLLSVGAVIVAAGRIRPAGSFSAFVHQSAPSTTENILVHGIGGDAQLAGRPQAEVILELQAFMKDCVPVAFHAAFDARILRRHGLDGRRQWLDAAQLAPALFPQRHNSDTLEAWLAEFGVPAIGRHSAIGDAFSTAQLLLVLLAEASRQRLDTLEALMQTQRAARWLAAR
jgi:DNA polymerase III subunit epsilon